VSGLASRRKGAAGEREVAAILRRRGIEAKRGYQARGGSDEPDVVHSIPNVRMEVKRVEKLNVVAAFRQCDDDLDPGDDLTQPVVVHRRNGCEWLVTMRFGDWLDQMGYFDEGGEG
jgi:hypothetical protein